MLLVQIQHHGTTVLSRAAILCSCAGHLWQETCVPFYIAGSQGHSSLSKLILHFDKCAVLSSAQTTDL